MNTKIIFLLSLFSVGVLAQTGYFSSGDLVMNRKSCDSPQKIKRLAVQLDDVADDVDWIVRRIDSSAAATSCPLRPTLGKTIFQSSRSPKAFQMSELVLTIGVEEQLLASGTSTCANNGKLEKGLLCLYAKEKEGNQIVLVAETNYRLDAELTARTVVASEVLPHGVSGTQNVAVLEWELERRGSRGMTFREAQAYAASRAAEGWRLPTIWELYTLYRQKAVLGDDLDIGWFWSDTVVANVDYYWFVHFSDGDTFHDGVGRQNRVRLVRG